LIQSIDFVSQSAAELLPGRPLQTSVAVISISTPGTWEPILADFEHVLKLEFHDVEDYAEPWVVFDRAHAKLVVDFTAMLQAKDEPVDVVVHCKAGISRSAAVALYVEAVSQCAFPRRRFAGFANRLVTRTLEAASGKAVPVPRALTRREEFSVRVLRDFEGGLTLVTAESKRNGEVAQVEGPIAEEGALIGRAVEQVAGFKDPPPAGEVQDWDFSL
jgi:predicted protein tyrosine phosphatase